MGLIFFFSLLPGFCNVIRLLLRWKWIVRKFCLVYFFTCLKLGGTLVLIKVATYYAEVTGQHQTLQALPSTSPSNKDLIIMNLRSEDLVFSPSPNSTVWPQANSSFLSLSFLICGTMGSTKRMLKNFLILKCDDIDDKEDAHEAHVHSDFLNG